MSVEAALGTQSLVTQQNLAYAGLRQSAQADQAVAQSILANAGNPSVPAQAQAPQPEVNQIPAQPDPSAQRGSYLDMQA